MKVTEDFMELAGHFEIDLEIKHHFFPGGYAKEMHIPKGYVLGQHAHKTAHRSVYIGGPLLWRTDENEVALQFPCGVIDIPALVKHQAVALGDTTLYCVWETDETDPEKIDESVIERA